MCHKLFFPNSLWQIDQVRRSVLKLAPTYTVEAVGLLAHHRAAPREALEGLMRTQSVRAHTAQYAGRIAQFLAAMTAPAS
jgi:hypothetical protein